VYPSSLGVSAVQKSCIATKTLRLSTPKLLGGDTVRLSEKKIAPLALAREKNSVFPPTALGTRCVLASKKIHYAIKRI